MNAEVTRANAPWTSMDQTMTNTATSLAASILMPTFDRADQLRVTLQSFTKIQTQHAFELVLINNNSTDHTEGVIDAFTASLPIRRLFESCPGKNAALNLALSEPGLAPIVVFTDDDISPSPGWLDSVVDSCAQYPETNVFGGRVRVDWPVDEIPEWALHPKVLGWGFAHLDLGDKGMVWPQGRFPVGSNYWVRREIVIDRRFDEHLGPRPVNRIMGDEATFLKQLADIGHRARYVPSATVHHRVQPPMVTRDGIRKRAYFVGRSTPHLWGLDRKELLQRSRTAWFMLRAFSLSRATVLYGLHCLRGDVVRSVTAMRAIAYNMENMRLARSHKRRDS